MPSIGSTLQIETLENTNLLPLGYPNDEHNIQTCRCSQNPLHIALSEIRERINAGRMGK